MFLFDQPTPTADSMPLAHADDDEERWHGDVQGRLDQSGLRRRSSTTRQPNYDGQSGPPPAGAPIGSYQKDGKAIPVTPGPDAKIKVSFDDSVRWK